MARYDKTRLIAATMLLAAIAAPAAAQEWPKGTTTIVVGLGPGSGLDIVARVLAEGLQRRLGTTFLVENKSGAAGNISVDIVNRAAPDGSSMVVAHSGPMVINPMIMKVPFNPWTDLAPVTIVSTTPSVIVVNRKHTVGSLEELVALLRKNPGKFTYGSVGAGSTSHLAPEAIVHRSGTEVVHVPYRATPEMIRAVIAGDVDFAAPVLSTIEPTLRQGLVRPIAITSASRWPSLPDIPTAVEAGFPEMPSDVWNGLFVPAATSKTIIDRIQREVRAVVDDPAVRARMRQVFYQPVGSTSKELADVMRAEERSVKPLLERAGLLLK
jgi:tripartite-type tricarboxylate transporter receptor subunit TctC